MRLNRFETVNIAIIFRDLPFTQSRRDWTEITLMIKYWSRRTIVVSVRYATSDGDDFS